MDGKIVKMEKDYSPQVDSLIPSSKALAKSGHLEQALESLLSLEKQTRVGADLDSNTKILLHVIYLTFTFGDQSVEHATLCEYVTLLSKRHGALKQAVTKMVQEAMKYLDEPLVKSDPARQTKLIETLRAVTDGKIYVEVERARLTKRLAVIQENAGQIATACDTMQELQVETFGSMPIPEKTTFILDQMRLTLLKKDYTRTLLTSKKINTKIFERHAGMKQLKVRHYLTMIDWGMREAQYGDVAKYWFEIYEALRPRDEEELQAKPKQKSGLGKDKAKSSKEATSSDKSKATATKDKKEGEKDEPEAMEEEDPGDVIENVEDKWRFALVMIVAFICLTPFGNETSDFLQRIYRDSNLAKLPLAKELAKLFVTQELMRFPKLEEIYGHRLKALIAFYDGTPGITCEPSPFTEAEIQVQAEDGKVRWKELHKRVIEHNIRVVSKYYTRITHGRLTSLLDLPPNETETYLSSLVVSGTIYARIDRPSGIINFMKREEPETELNDWNNNLKSLLKLVEKTTHLITKEEMVQRIQKKAGDATQPVQSGGTVAA